MIERTKESMKLKFMQHFKLTEKDLKRLWALFNEYGLTAGEAKHRSSGNHYFLQGISQYYTVEFHTWRDKMTPELISIVTKEYPQLLTQHKKFEWR